MGTIIASTIIDKAQTILQDTTGIRWPDDELLGWLNDGQREIVIYKPNASVKNQSVALAAGTKQTIPADGVQLIDIPRNMGNGSTPGRSIRITMREVLDAQVPNWHALAKTTEIKHYTYTPLDPKTYYVYPPAVAGTQVEMIYAAAPTNVGSSGSAITIDDIYQTVLLDYVLYRAYSKDTEYAADTNRAAAHQNAYLAAIGGKAKVEAAVNPNATAPANPNVTPNTR